MTASEELYLTVGEPKVFTPRYRRYAFYLHRLSFLQALALLGLAACAGAWVPGMVWMAGLVAPAALAIWSVLHIPAGQRRDACHYWREELLETLPPCEHPRFFGRLELDERSQTPRWRGGERADFGVLIFEPDALRFVGESVSFRIPMSYLTYAARRPVGWLSDRAGIFGVYLMLFKPINGVHGIAFGPLDGDTFPQRRRVVRELKQRLKPLWTEVH